jgi:hypothetical protein
MSAARFRLYLTAGLFLGWLGWLAYLAVTAGTWPVSRKPPVILSGPQFLVSTLDVIAEVKADDGRPAPTVTVVAVHWPPGEPEKLKGASLTVTNLERCTGWDGPGEYILPLEPSGKDYQVAPTPPSPGYPGSHFPASPWRIYRRTPETLRQLEMIPKPEAPPGNSPPPSGG